MNLKPPGTWVTRHQAGAHLTSAVEEVDTVIEHDAKLPMHEGLIIGVDAEAMLITRVIDDTHVEVVRGVAWY